MEQFGQNNNEKNEDGIKEDFSYTESSEYANLNQQIDMLLESTFHGVEVDQKREDHFDPNYKALHDNHFDHLINDEFEIKRTLRFENEDQQKEFHRLVDILRNGTSEEQKELLHKIGYYKDTE